ncbi:MAG: hypothetical protein Q4F23_02365 [Coriobacteriia bacterium]|nr:hypothetical protein [Coriobacteriia bacterium]
MDTEEKKWKQLQQALEFEITGKAPRPACSMRTLFGIKSEVEEKMERFAREIEEERMSAHSPDDLPDKATEKREDV